MKTKTEKEVKPKANTSFRERLYPRDIIGGMTLIVCLYLISQGINHIVSGIAIMVITYYFSKRLYEEKNGRK